MGSIGARRTRKSRLRWILIFRAVSAQPVTCFNAATMYSLGFYSTCACFHCLSRGYELSCLLEFAVRASHTTWYASLEFDALYDRRHNIVSHKRSQSCSKTSPDVVSWCPRQRSNVHSRGYDDGRVGDNVYGGRAASRGVEPAGEAEIPEYAPRGLGRGACGVMTSTPCAS
ncbi:hypothetical protein C2E23DRAFT_32599 [Lenzites betulinus]|nr:hypothetical protein C2E23DRAFT_32599 [Lenzites betulinus]